MIKIRIRSAEGSVKRQVNKSSKSVASVRPVHGNPVSGPTQYSLFRRVDDGYVCVDPPGYFEPIIRPRRPACKLSETGSDPYHAATKLGRVSPGEGLEFKFFQIFFKSPLVYINYSLFI